MNKVRSRIPGRRGLLGMGLAAVVALTVPVPHARADAACAGRYTLSVDTVIDNDTKLTWQRNKDPKTYNWSDAQTHCQNLPLPGGNWRLPTMFELQTIVDESRYNPAIDTVAFPQADSDTYWSSSSVAGSSTYAWCVQFHDGNSCNGDVGGPGRVRCVR